MKNSFIVLAAPLALVACMETNPLTGGGGGVTEEPELELPPGTETPTPDDSIERYEEEDGTGNGYAQSITYDEGNDEFYVDNLAFDGGDNTYSRDDELSDLGPFSVYENDAMFQDSLTGVPIEQHDHRAIYAVSDSGQTRFAIVRTGSFLNYGFGGFLYAREGGYTVPPEGERQVALRGNYAGLRDFNGEGGMEYVTGIMSIDIDFEDFNASDAVKGKISNREIYDLNGDSLTAMRADQINETSMPDLVFTVAPGTINEDGEMAGTLGNSYTDDFGDNQTFESGNFYAVVAGEGLDMEVTGIVVVTSSPEDINYTIRETGGFILYR